MLCLLKLFIQYAFLIAETVSRLIFLYTLLEMNYIRHNEVGQAV